MSPVRLTQADRIAAVGLAAASDLNDELTTILSAIGEAQSLLHRDHPAYDMLSFAGAAADQCTRKTAGLLAFCGVRHKSRPVPISMESLIQILDHP